MVRNLGNTFQTAKPFPVSETRRTIKAALTSQDQIDIWKISPKVRSSLDVTLNGIRKKANADIDLIDAAGRLIKFSNLRGNKTDTLSKIPLEAGTFYLRVKLQRQSRDTRYALTVSATPSNDLFGNSFETATQLTSATGDGKDFVGNSDPDDFLKFGALVAGRFNFNLTGSNDASLELYDNSRNLIAVSNSAGTLNETLNQQLTGIAGSTYYVRIAQASGKEASYSFNYSFASDAVTRTASGLQYIDLATGTGATPQTGQTVTVNYTGILLNGTKFDSSRDRNLPFSFPIGEGRVIKGWDEGLSTMKVGGRRQLIVPANLAYGSSGNSVIPANATLIFDVEVIGISG
ncbi:MAG: FKBP-type peptidyl-prolyl cis-trans isomerase [Drouetiella hepatica Uher 2000/2452]|jgi:peptidylprolyl isomerase|uniref:peptidylprolyl isomerase n=1 Tax=Drouetiella hepatica Uher 2000/2452 TaxID=904376 RepID=A0A951Q6T4_9CYAN|nr:FKBP-type peptidyl-prolyl cis-trans isomerase [Drouetiella hepatica Uher 2000/2452]